MSQHQSAPVLEVEDLSVSYRMDDGPDVEAVRGVSFEVERGRTFGIVGESGCGKTTAANSIIQLLDDNGEITAGSVRLNGRDLTELSDAEIRSVRWSEIAVIPQNVMNSLNPVKTVGEQIFDVIQLHTDRSRTAAREHAEDLFDRVGVDPTRLDDYPHEFSGGMLQRAVIAMAISCDPDLLIADEPTTALDVIVQDEILAELRELQDEFDLSMLVISHDIGVMAEVCDDLGVMYGGQLMERGATYDVFSEPANPYTLGLQNSFPDIDNPDDPLVSIPGTAPDPSDPPTGCPFTARCPFATEDCERNPDLADAPGTPAHVSRCHFVDDVERLRREAADPSRWSDEAAIDDSAFEPSDEPVYEVDGLTKHFDTGVGLLDRLRGEEPTPVRAVDDVSFEINRGEMFGIVGESGCGKSTLGRVLLKLLEATDGAVRFDGQDLTSLARRDEQSFRSEAQIVFQDPFESLNPRLTVRQTLMEPLSLLGSDRTYAERLDRVEEMLEEVGLSPAREYLDRFPDQMSGGELQRVAIARALIVEPSFILADEPVSMLDVSIRANIINLLRQLRLDHDLTYGIISHDISLVRNLCDRTGVMYLGEFVEFGETAAVVDDPKHPYTQALVDSVPSTDPTRARESADIKGETPSARDPPSGCRFHTRCPAVIPPAEYDFEQERFRELMDLRQAIETGSLTPEFARRRAGSEDPATVADDVLSSRFDGALSDSEAEQKIIEALEQFAVGDVDAAAERLAAEFTSPCERRSPEFSETEDGRLVACHLYEADVETGTEAPIGSRTD
jgi:peptide/nickel transport system ATP-binding protein